jgi:transposase
MELIKPKSERRINEKALLITVDIGKRTNVGYGRCPNRAEIKPFAFSNDRPGFDKLWNRIQETQAQHKLERVVLGFESTAAYGEPLVHYLKDRPVELVQVNPMHTKKMKELQGNSPNKTDKKDPKVIADIIELGHFLTVVVPEGPAAELRRLSQARERAVERQGVLLNQLHSLVFLLFPEFLQVMKGLKTKSAHYLLDRYPLPQNMVDLGLPALTAELKKASNGRLPRERAGDLLEAARQSVGLSEGQASMLLEVQGLLRGLETTRDLIRSAEQEMDRHLDQIPYSGSIQSIKGIGKVTAAGLIGEVGDFRKFRTLAEVLKLAGLDLFEVSSGQHQGKRHISKRGRAFLRKLLYFAALGMVRKKGIMYATYQRHLEKGMAKPKALIAIARKVLGLVFALVRNHSTYHVNYENPVALPLAARNLGV